MKRIVVLMTVVALMMVMMAMSVAPAVFAHSVTCTGGSNTTSYSASYDPSTDKDGDGVICGTGKHDGSIMFKDDHGYPNGH